MRAKLERKENGDQKSKLHNARSKQMRAAPKNGLLSTKNNVPRAEVEFLQKSKQTKVGDDE